MKIIYALLIITLMGVILTPIMYVKVIENTKISSKVKYKAISYILPNGTPCFIIRGGTHSGYIGITCNYR